MHGWLRENIVAMSEEGNKDRKEERKNINITIIIALKIIQYDICS
jgi:hypothetical protein